MIEFTRKSTWFLLALLLLLPACKQKVTRVDENQGLLTEYPDVDPTLEVRIRGMDQNHDLIGRSLDLTFLP